jgi:hypothetical protein
MEAYAFLMRRPADEKMFPGGFPVIYADRTLAEKAFGRISPVVEVSLLTNEECAEVDAVIEELCGHPPSEPALQESTKETT